MVSMGPTYAGLTTFLSPMSQVSNDLFGNIKVMYFPGSRQTCKIFPLIVGDLIYKAVQIELLEGHLEWM